MDGSPNTNISEVAHNDNKFPSVASLVIEVGRAGQGVSCQVFQESVCLEYPDRTLTDSTAGRSHH